MRVSLVFFFSKDFRHLILSKLILTMARMLRFDLLQSFSGFFSSYKESQKKLKMRTLDKHQENKWLTLISLIDPDIIIMIPDYNIMSS